MKVCMIGGSYPPMKDGVGDYTRQLFLALKRVLGSENVSLITTATSLSVSQRREGVYGIVRKWDLRSTIGVGRLILKLRPNLLHIQYPGTGYGRAPFVNLLPPLIRAARPSIKIVSTLHEFGNLRLRAKLRLLPGILASHKIIIVDAGYERSLRAAYAPLSRKLVCIPVGPNVEPQLPRPAGGLNILRQRLGIGRTAPVISFFGIIRGGKGIVFLVRAFCQLLRRRPSAKLLLIGHVHEGYFRTHIASLALQLGITEHIVLTGSCHSEQLSEYLSISDVCVLPFEDGASTRRSSLILAIAHELPIVTTPPKSAFPGLANGVNVVLVEHGNVGQLCDEVDALIGDVVLRDRIKQNVALLKQRYSWANIAKETADLYRSVTHLP